MNPLQLQSAAAVLAPEIGGTWLAFVGLLALRVAATFAMTPIFYAVPLPASVRMLLVLGLSIALAFGLSAPVGAWMGWSELLFSALAELALGATLGLGILLAFGAFSIAGQLLDVQLGFGIAQVIDPVTQRPIPVLTSAFNYLAVLVFFLLNGHHALLRGISYSVERFPVGASWSIGHAVAPVLKQAAGLFSLGFALAAPVVFREARGQLSRGAIYRDFATSGEFATLNKAEQRTVLAGMDAYANARNSGGLMAVDRDGRAADAAVRYAGDAAHASDAIPEWVRTGAESRVGFLASTPWMQNAIRRPQEVSYDDMGVMGPNAGPPKGSASLEQLGLSKIPLPRTPELGSTSTTTELLQTGAIPGREGVILQQRVVPFDDIWQLSRSSGVEFALTKENGSFVLRSGSPTSVSIPSDVRPIAHTHPVDAYGENALLPSRADINVLNNYWYRNPTAPRPVSQILTGQQPPTRFHATGLDQWKK